MPHQLAEVLPNLGSVIGAEAMRMGADAPPLPHTEAQQAFQRALVAFVSVYATAEHPLVLFVDDLQW